MSTNCGRGVSTTGPSAVAATAAATTIRLSFTGRCLDWRRECGARLLPFSFVRRSPTRRAPPAFLELFPSDAFELLELPCGLGGLAQSREGSREGVSCFVAVGLQFECAAEGGHRFCVPFGIEVQLADAGVCSCVAGVDEQGTQSLR